MLDKLLLIKKEAEEKIEKIDSLFALEEFRLEFLVKKGKITELFNFLKNLEGDAKREFGKELNILKKSIEAIFEEISENLKNTEEDKTDLDLSLPGRTNYRGTRHPISQTIDLMIEIFGEMGFSVAEGPDIEDGFHNFDALNFPSDHPARDMQDTFFIQDERELVLRTHTSPVQIRLMENMKPPIRKIMPGRVYRNEAIDATHLAEFHQIEGLYINKDVSFAQLKATMITFAERLYGNDLEFRFRPSFFPFTEPSAELDIKRKGSNKWMEIAGCGMVHPNVLKAGGIDPEEYTGFAFGFGIERITMLKTGIDDIRLLYENDIRVLQQF